MPATILPAGRLLEGPRRRVFETVRDLPGLHLREVARHAGLETNHAKHHLRHLEQSGLVSSRKADGYWRFFPREAGSAGLRDALDPMQQRWLSLLRREVPLRVVTLLLGQPDASQSELAARLAVARGTLHHHLGKLQEAGLVASRREGRKRCYWVPDSGRVTDLVTRYRPPDPLVEAFLEAWWPLRLRPHAAGQQDAQAGHAAWQHRIGPVRVAAEQALGDAQEESAR